MEELYKLLIEKIKNDFGKNNTNFLDVFFKERSDSLYHSIAQNKEYKSLFQKLNEKNFKIEQNSENSEEIINAIEEHEDAMSELNVLSEKLMYQYGLRDGINLIFSALFNNNFLVEENKNE